jgi:hypothetical protein
MLLLLVVVLVVVVGCCLTECKLYLECTFYHIHYGV